MALASTSTATWRAADVVIAGLVASIVYTIAVQVIILATAGAGSFFTPFRQIAAVAMGPQALSDNFSLPAAVVVGTVVHLVIGVVYAAIFALIAHVSGLRSFWSLVGFGALYGLVIYAVNILVIFPNWFPWFLENSRVVQASLHALAFGAVVGWSLSTSRRN